MALSVIQACRGLALSTWLLSFCFVHLLCLDFTVAEKEEWYTAFVNITYVAPDTAEVRTEKTECGRYGEHSLKREARGVLAIPVALHDKHACMGGVATNNKWQFRDVARYEGGAFGHCHAHRRLKVLVSPSVNIWRRQKLKQNKTESIIHNVASSSEKVVWSESGEKQEMDFITGGRVIMDILPKAMF